MENNEHYPRGDVGGAPLRSVLRADQHAPDRGRGGLHRRQQRRQGDHRVSATAQDVRGPRDELPDGLPELLLIADDDLTAGSAIRNVSPTSPIRPIDDEREGDLLQYSSGTTGRPKGIKRELPHLPPAEAPGLMSALVGLLDDPDAVYLSPAPLYHTAPSVWSMRASGAGITTVVMEKFDAEGSAGRDPALPRHTRPVRPGDVHPHAETA